MSAAPLPNAFQTEANSEVSREYKLKAAFIYNFTKFITWPDKAFQDGTSSTGRQKDAPIVIGIIGKSPFGDAFKPITEKKVRGREVKILQIKGPSQLLRNRSNPNHEQINNCIKSEIEKIKKCEVLFIAPSEHKYVGRILKNTAEMHLLTISDFPGFADKGGMINFVKSGRKVRFEVNLAVAKKHKLKISSKLLSLAVRVIQDEPDEKAASPADKPGRDY
ncbi:YfiR family protein [Anaerohalosphaera lusitana]|uniref:YfiR family protein n=1 Tax=Anaerohalosphaera lusitana TaxID=1936003 RepID=UPI00197C3D2D|nr:YfiR family protein [Anaerohalosphaera lusitana]